MALASEVQFEQCVDTLYRTLASPVSLPATLAHVADFLDADCASFIRTDAAGDVTGFVGHGYDLSIQREFVAHYAAIDPARVPMITGTPGVWVQDDDAFDERQTSSPEYVVDFAPRAGIRWLRGVKLHQDAAATALVSFVRPRDARAFDDHSMSLMARLFPHLARVSRLLLDLEKLPAPSTMTQAAAEALSVGVCAVDTQLRVVYANKAALNLLGAHGPLQVRGNVLSGSSTTVQSQLRSAVTLATKPPYQARSFAPNPDDVLAQRLQIRVMPLTETDVLANGSVGRFALLFFSRGASPLRADELEQLFGLTHTEAELVRMLGQGLTPAICADRRRVGMATVRTQLSSIYAKTGVTSLPQLVTLVLALPGQG